MGDVHAEEVHTRRRVCMERRTPGTTRFTNGGVHA